MFYDENSFACFYFCLVVRQVKPQFMSTPSHGFCGHRQRANTTHDWLPWLRHCPARHGFFLQVALDTLAKAHIIEATLAFVQRSTCFERAPLIDTCNLKFWMVFFSDSTLSELKFELVCAAA